MERLVEVKLAKVHILSILDCYYRLFLMIYISYDSEGITIQRSCEDQKILVTMTIPRDSFESYGFQVPRDPHGRGEPMVLAVPITSENWVESALAFLFLRSIAGELRMSLNPIMEFPMKLLVAICINYRHILLWIPESHLRNIQLQRSV